MRLVIAARRLLARRADLCILPNARRAEEFSRATGRRDVLTVWNCPMPQDVAEAKAVTATGLRVLYHGSIVPSRLPLAVVDAIATLPPSVSLVIAGYETAGHQGHVAALLSRAAALGIADRVTDAGTLPRRADLMAQCAGCDVGLALMPLTSPDLNERAMVGASNKPFDYMAGGLALLVSDLPDWQATFEDAGYALSCDPASAESVASRLRWFLEHPAARLEMGERGRRRIAEDWNYSRMFAGVLEHVSRRPERQSRSITSVQSRA
jgi:glycosyltransferase involved in cell wall biosynthesis